MADKITRMGLKDLGECAQMYTKIFTASPWNEPWTERLAHRRLNHLFERRGAIGFVYKHDNKIAGFLLGNWVPWLDGNAFVLKEICVDKEILPASGEKYSGIGSEMLDRLYAFLKMKNVGVIELVTVRDSDAFKFFESKGFVAHEKLAFMSKNHSNEDSWENEHEKTGNCHCYGQKHDRKGKYGCCGVDYDLNSEMEDAIDAHIQHEG